MKLHSVLETVLKKEPNYVTDNGELKKWVVINKAQNADEELITLLLNDKTVKEQFFRPVAGALVFNQHKFIQFLEQKNFLNDSYTQFKNKIGLTINGKYLKQRNEVALVWPFKDCILEGGQSREEENREEIFFNEILAQDEITQLLEPKVLTNAKRIDENGEKPLDKFNRNKEGAIIDNLIIKGNNLLALHSLKKEFEGKVKLIYIDPPYNTGNDGFNYNDAFNHSSWLSFVKNRLEISKVLLSNDGSIWINIDDREAHYLKVLADEIFGRDNFIANVIWQKKFAPQNDAKFFSDNHDHILVFSKERKNWKINLLSRSDKSLSNYKNPDNDPRGDWTSGDLTVKTYNAAYDYEIVTPSGKRIHPPKGICWRVSKDKFNELIKDNRVWFGESGNNVPRLKRFLTEVKEGTTPMTIWPHTEVAHNQEAKQEINALLGSGAFSTPKPERLLQRIIQIASNEGDLVLDFFIGSGTTAAVAHKMKRQFIGIEQMDYVDTVAVVRLKKVIDGEQSGISESVNWQGGGSFVYLELKKYNQNFIDQIEEAKDLKALLKIWEQMKTKSFFNYNVDLKKQEEHLYDFKALTLKEQKQHLCELLDKNQLYVNLSSLEDKSFASSTDEKKVTKDFYRVKG